MKATIKAAIKAMIKALIKKPEMFTRGTKMPPEGTSARNGNGKDNNSSGEQPGTELTQIRSATSVRMRGGARSGDEIV